MKNILGLAAAGGVVLALTVSGSGAVASQTAHTSTSTSEKPSGALQARRADDSLDEVARLLGSALGDKTLRQQIRDQIDKRGTPDHAVTFGSLSRSSDLRAGLAATVQDERSISASEAEEVVDELTAALPPAQVSVPVKMGAWNAATVAPLVAYVPVGIDDSDLETVTAYDARGREHVLDAWVEPDQPVVVLGPDETMLHEGSTAGTTSTDLSPRAATLAADAPCYHARMTYVRLVKDHEPWAKGMAEIFLAAKGKGLFYKDEFPYLEMDGDQIWPNEYLGCAENDVAFYWWEDDSASYDFTLGYGGISFGVAMADEDDLIGGRMLDWSTFSGTSERTTDFTDLIMKTH